MATTAWRLPDWLKNLIGIVSLFWAGLGFPCLVGFLCFATMSGFSATTYDLYPALASFTLAALTGGAGLVITWHAFRSAAHSPSTPMHLRSVWYWGGLFVVCLICGWFLVQIGFIPALFLPPLLLAAAAAPPLFAMAWFASRSEEALTWRRGLVAFAGGATISVSLAAALEVLAPGLVLTLVSGLADTVLPQISALLAAPVGYGAAAKIANPTFVFVFVQLAIVAPLVEELVKPLVTLPVLGYLKGREAFLVAAMAGAGFAALENVLYASLGISFWTGVLVVRALGGAIHPLGAGLVGLGWRDVLRGEPQAWRKWGLRYGLAVSLHALWNGGSLLVIGLAGEQFVGRLPAGVNALGLSAAGITLAVLAVAGLAALWLGRRIAQGTDAQAEAAPLAPVLGGDQNELAFPLSDRTVAIWALACLAAIVPAGITGLQLLMR
jgi:RsiW-degrading membrane proteinase PrsW (M82 family)